MTFDNYELATATERKLAAMPRTSLISRFQAVSEAKWWVDYWLDLAGRTGDPAHVKEAEEAEVRLRRLEEKIGRGRRNLGPG